MSESEIDKIIPKLQVIARAAPTDKYILVHRLRELGEVVAVTGECLIILLSNINCTQVMV